MGWVVLEQDSVVASAHRRRMLDVTPRSTAHHVAVNRGTSSAARSHAAAISCGVLRLQALKHYVVSLLLIRYLTIHAFKMAVRG